MITLTEFNQQLPTIAEILCRWKKSDNVVIPKELSHNEPLQVNGHLTDNLLFDINIQYNQLYRVPNAKFRFWKLSLDEDGTCVSCGYFLTDVEFRSLLDLKNHSVTLTSDSVTKEIWYSINDCDTEINIGPEPEQYLTRWLSVYISIFDSKLNDLFV